MGINNTKTEILAAIAKTDDHNLKMILLLMLGIMEEIGSKIDRIYSDKALLKESVLNGHAEIHHDDHEWIKHRRQDYEVRRAFMERAKPAVEWVEQRKLEEADTKKTVKTSFIQNTLDTLGKVIWAIVGVGAYLVFSGKLPII